MKRNAVENLPPLADPQDDILPTPPFISDADVGKIVSAYKNVSTQELLGKYDLHHIELRELEVFLTLLHQRREIREDAAARLLIHAYCVFEEMPDDTKVDFIEALEMRAQTLVGASDPDAQNGMVLLLSDNINCAIGDAKSMDIARNSNSAQPTRN